MEVFKKLFPARKVFPKGSPSITEVKLKILIDLNYIKYVF